MKLINCSEILRKAVNEHYAVPQFNVNGLEWCRTVLKVCQDEKSPVILGTAMAAVSSMGGYTTVVNFVNGLIEDLVITVPVALHLDHGNYEACIKCYEAGYTSVMFDGSKYPFEENIAKTKELVDFCAKKNITVEAEVGSVGAAHEGAFTEGEIADPEECGIISKTGITMLAVGIGNIHGVYPSNWKGLNWEVLTAIKKRVGDLPLVLHGGSGIPEAMLKEAIRLGVSKININTELQIAFMNKARDYFETGKDKEEKGYFIRNLINYGLKGIEPVLREKIKLFGCAGKG
jgi:fructose-bisphosphate aldolase class II